VGSKKKQPKSPALSVIIVNYNVREFLQHALISVQKAMKGIRGEIIVVDNASDDGSVEMVKRKFPSVRLITSKINLGFAKANNLAIREAVGRHLLLLNPDTVVQEDTFSAMLKFFDDNPDVGLAGCKILNPDGSFQRSCRRSFPTPWVAFTKISGLSNLFPQSRLFGKYNLTYLSEDETYEIDAVSGSFMMLRREVVEDVGGLDEEYFMYGEDLDWCYRIQKAGWKIYYVPATKIIHYKGESTRRSNIDEIKTFYEAMHLFVKKHIGRSWIAIVFLRLAITLSSRLAMLREFIRPLSVGLVDILIIDLCLVAAELIWLGTIFYFPAYGYPIVYTVPALIVVTTLYASGVYTHRRMSVSRTFAGVVLSFVLISALVAFFRDYAFSRMVIVLSGVFSTAFLPGWRLIYRMRGSTSVSGRQGLFGKRIVVVGTDAGARKLYQRLRQRVAEGFQIVGFVDTTRKFIGEKIDGLPILGSLENIGKVIHEHRISDVIFSTAQLSYVDILSVISRAGNRPVNYHLVPNTLEVIIGKGNVDTLDELPLVEISYNLDRPFNRIVKRGVDIVLSGLLLISVYPFVYWKYKQKPSRSSHALLGLPDVFNGRKSLVGPPLRPEVSDSNRHVGGSPALGKPGMTGLVQLHRNRPLSDAEAEQFNLYYARNQSMLLDLEILLKSLLMPAYRQGGEISPTPEGVVKLKSKRMQKAKKYPSRKREN